MSKNIEIFQAIHLAIQKKIVVSLPLCIDINEDEDENNQNQRIIANYFNLFQLDIDFNVNQAQLKKKYLVLQAQTHPDKMLHLPIEQQKYALDWSMLINTAYQTLKSISQRAIYICQIHHINIQEKIDIELIKQTMLWYEMLENVENKSIVLNSVNNYIDAYTQKFTQHTKNITTINNINNANNTKTIAQIAQSLVMLENFLTKL
jgi:molecular chaperone HscB